MKLGTWPVLERSGPANVISRCIVASVLANSAIATLSDIVGSEMCPGRAHHIGGNESPNLFSCPTWTIHPGGQESVFGNCRVRHFSFPIRFLIL